MFSRLNYKKARVWVKVPDNTKDFDSEMSRIGAIKKEGLYIFSPGRWSEDPLKKQAIIVKTSEDLKVFSVFYLRYRNDRELTDFLKNSPSARVYPLQDLWELFYDAYFEGLENKENNCFYTPKREFLGLYCA
jgi:hypothetical protein